MYSGKIFVLEMNKKKREKVLQKKIPQSHEICTDFFYISTSMRCNRKQKPHSKQTWIVKREKNGKLFIRQKEEKYFRKCCFDVFLGDSFRAEVYANASANDISGVFFHSTTTANTPKWDLIFCRFSFPSSFVHYKVSSEKKKFPLALR